MQEENYAFNSDKAIEWHLKIMFNPYILSSLNGMVFVYPFDRHR